MNHNADFAERVLLHADAIPWTPSPMAGVDRRMLDRIGSEVARATSLVRYAPGSAFPPHTHGGGEEFIVVDGIFQDEHGDYPTGTYVRNPPGTSHHPGSQPGCTIFVKLWQFDPDDRQQLAIDMDSAALTGMDGRTDVSGATLFRNHREEVRIEQWAPGARVAFDAPDGAEVLVLSGSCNESGQAMERLSWLRVPSPSRIDAVAGPEGARVWIKLGNVGYSPISELQS